eukprot:948645-Prorocentrum_lima.AAC.1
MTSSLVGSEMCIRDRKTRQEQVAEISRGVDMFVTRLVEQKWQDRMGPVSYTHLTLPTICSV